MLPFLSMLQGAGGSRLGQAIGTKGASFIQPSDKKIGMQYANMGLQAPEVPNMMNMLAGLNQMSGQQQRAPLQVYDIMRMLQGG